MKEKIFERVKEALGKTGLSDRTLQKKSEILAKTVTTEDLLTDELIDDVVEELKTMEGQLNNEVATKVKEQIKKLEGKKPQEKDTPPENKEKVDGSPAEDETLKTLLEEVRALKEEREKEKNIESRKNLEKSIIASLKENGADNETLLKAALYESKIDFDKSVEDNVKSIRKAYDEEASKSIPEAQPFFGGGGGQKNEETLKAERKERKEKILKEVRI